MATTERIVRRLRRVKGGRRRVFKVRSGEARPRRPVGGEGNTNE